VHATGNLLSATFGATRETGRWQIDGYYQYGQNRALLRYTDTLRIDRVYRGIDSVVNPADGRIVCRSTLTFPDDGCVPVNIFGEGSVSPAARAYITEGSYEQAQDVAEHVAELTVQGWLAELPAGKVNVAAGINWRRESVDNSPRRIPAELESIVVAPAETLGYRGLPAAYIGASNIFERTVVNTVAGHYAVWEAFGEAAVPVVAELPGIDLLTAHGALRVAHYSGSGAVLAWKGGLDLQVDTALRLRATRSRDVRAGSLSERFDVNSGGITIVDALRPGSPAYAVVFTRTGSPDVAPELSDTWTAGLVFAPEYLRGFSLAADYYDIRIHDAISAYGVQNIINLCRDGRQDLCGLIERGAASGLIQRVNNPVTNVTEARTRGIDFEVSLRRPVRLLGGDESLALRLFANRTLEASVTGISGAAVDRADQTGQVGGAPRWQANMSIAYWRGPLRLTLQQRVISSGRFNATLAPGALDDNTVRAATYTNLRASRDSRRWPGLQVYAQASNLFDHAPPRAVDWGFVGSLPTNESLFDVLGRRYVLGISWER
jgi:outer membrane receptor protein involved in Fe transport